MTHATKAIYRGLLLDYVKVSNISAGDILYTETDWEESRDKTNGQFCYHLGHVLGATMFTPEIAGLTLLYIGDF